MRFSRWFPVLFMSVGLFALAGCQSGGMGVHSSAGPTKAVVVNGPHGGTTVYFPSSGGDGVQAMSSAGSTEAECAQCKADAANYFKTGKLDPVCSVCGAHRSPVIMSH